MQLSQTDLRDETRGTLDGHKFRVICAANRQSPARLAALVEPLPADPITTGSDRYGDFIRFEVRDGDLSANEARDYKGREKNASERAMLAFEGDGSKERIGKRVEMSFGLVIEPGPRVRHPDFFCVFAQWNSYPRDRKSLHPPPGELGLTYTERKTRRASDGRQIVVRDALGAPVVDERLYWRVHALKNGKPGTVFEALSEPIQRDRFYRIVIALVDSGGEPDGRGEFHMDDRLQGTVYEGPAGFVDNSGPYAGLGVYRLFANNGVTAARIYDWREGLKSAD